MSLTKVSYAMTNGSPVNVLDFGAVGDGTTNDTAAIQAAINSLPTNGGAVYLPAGNYLISSTLTQTKRLFLFGDGVSNVGGDVGSTQITKAASMTTQAITLSIGGSCIQDLDFRGNTGNTGDGIQISCARARLSNIGVYTMGQDGVRVGTDAGVNCNVYYFEQLKCKSNIRYGLHLSDQVAPTLPDANSGTISGADFQSNGNHGFYINNSRLGAYSGITAQNNGGDGVHLTTDATNHTFMGGDCENNTGYNIYIGSGAVDNVILNLVNGSGTAATKILDLGNGTIWSNDDGRKDISNDIKIEGTTTAGVGTYGTKWATAVRRAGRVDVIIQVRWTAHTGTGNIKVTGLPYISHSFLGRTMTPIGADDLTYGAGTLTGYIENSSSEIQIFLQATGATLANVPMDTSGTLFIQIMYVPAD